MEFTPRAFSTVAPQTWNSLTLDLVALFTPLNDISRPTYSDSVIWKPPAPLYPTNGLQGAIISHVSLQKRITAVPVTPWGPPSPGSPVWMAEFYALWLPVLFYFHDVGITQFACCELLQHVLLRIHDERMYRMRHWQFVMIWSNIGGLHGADPTGFGISLPRIVHWLGWPMGWVGLGWVASGWVEIFQLFVVWVGSTVAKVLKFERIMLMHLKRG